MTKRPIVFGDCETCRWVDCPRRPRAPGRACPQRILPLDNNGYAEPHFKSLTLYEVKWTTTTGNRRSMVGYRMSAGLFEGWGEYAREIVRDFVTIDGKTARLVPLRLVTSFKEVD